MFEAYDRDGSFDLHIIGKHERRLTGFDQEIIAIYVRGMRIREIQGYLAEMYGTEISNLGVASSTARLAEARCANG